MKPRDILTRLDSHAVIHQQDDHRHPLRLPRWTLEQEAGLRKAFENPSSSPESCRTPLFKARGEQNLAVSLSTEP